MALPTLQCRHPRHEPQRQILLGTRFLGREAREDENAAEEWRAYLDVHDGLPVFCPECAEREFA
jgi:hypothetical protein